MRPLKNMCEVAVIGGGVAGLSAALHAARLGRLVTLFEGSGLYGGQVATVGELDGLPPLGRFSGQDLAIALLEQARKSGVQIVEARVAAIDLGAHATLIDEQERSYLPDAIIVATGASLRKLGVPGETELTGRGVSHCATCDGAFYRDQDVVVVGGGDAALQEALVLTGVCRRVIMVCRSALGAKREYIDRIASKENVAFVWGSEVTEVLGEGGVSGVRLRDVKTGAASELACFGVFPFIGVVPSTDFVPKALLNPTGRIRTQADFASADPRLFAAGAVREGYGGNVAQAIAEGIGAAEAAARRPVRSQVKERMAVPA